MALSSYKKKRNFNKTKEPAARQKSGRGALKFVIQKHDASRLHYDFRIELEGVLKSWAVPKGPSLDPAEKRLAMHVEDHPYAYKDFEGVIPEGEYGGGTVIVWDEGTYYPMGGEALPRKEQEKLLLQQFKKGDLKLHLEGTKIKGDYALFHLKKTDNSWLLVKKKDKFATSADVRLKGDSVKSGKTLAEVAAAHHTEVKHPDQDVAAPKKKAAKSKTAAKRKTAVQGGKRAAMPTSLVPMKAVLADEAFDDEDWIFEIKWDGFRALAYCNGKKVSLQSRNLKSFTNTYTPVTAALKELELKAVFDGEIVAVNEDGLPDFQLLQNWQNTPTPLQFLVFDMLWLDGYDLRELPLVQRKKLLQEILPQNDVIRYSEHIQGSGKDFFRVAVEKGLEGIMAKHAESSYLAGKRSDHWLKIKAVKRQEVVVAGYTAPRNSRSHFGALLLGVYEGGKLHYVGHTGSGFDEQALEHIYEKMQVLKVKRCPFAQVPKTNQAATWIKPQLVAEIKFTEWTKDGLARHPIFLGLRSDKKATDVVREQEKKITRKVKESIEEEVATERAKKSSGAAPAKKTSALKARTAKKAPNKAAKKATPRKTSSASKPVGKTAATSTASKSKASAAAHPLDLSAGAEQTIRRNRHELKLTNLDKLYWKKEKFSKGDMLNYYLRMAPFILPHLKNRPLSLNRHPNGINGKSFYQKDVAGKVPEWVDTHPEISESSGNRTDYFVCKDEAHLVYMANLGCIEMNPWHSRKAKPDFPDWCLIDLDPDDPNPFDQVIEVAQVVKQVLDSIGVDAWPKTSGSTGIHIFIPLGAKYTYDQSRQLAELLVHLVHDELRSFTSLERSPAKRKGKIYLDYLQNRYGQTAASVYSLRPRPGMPVSTPLHWDELKKGLKPTDFTALNIFDRLREVGDLFAPVLGKGIDMRKALKNLQSLLDI